MAVMERIAGVFANRATAAAEERALKSFTSAMQFTMKSLPKFFTADAAMKLPAVQKAVARLAGDVAALPMVVEQRSGAEWARVEEGDDEAAVVTERWMFYESAALGVEKVMRSLALHGLAAVLIERDGLQLRELVVLDPVDVERVQRNLGIVSDVDTKVLGKTIPRGRLALWYWSPPLDRHTRRPPLAEGWAAVRAGLAATVFSSGYFDYAALGRLLLKPPPQPSSRSREDVQKANERNDKLRSEGRSERVLPRGWEAMIVPAEGRDVVLDMRRFAAKEVSRILGPPQPMLDVLDRSNYANIGEARRDYYQTFVGGWARKLGTELSRAIWPEGERRVRLSVEESMLYSPLERATVLEKRLRNGVISQNEWRRVDGLEPDESDPLADRLIRSPTTLTLVESTEGNE